MSRKDEIQSACEYLGKETTFYDGLLYLPQTGGQL